jgi:hypothetical protein
MKTQLDSYDNGVAIWDETLTDNSRVYYVRVYHRDMPKSFIEFACEDYTHAVNLAQELESTVGTTITLEGF